ncbi:FAD-dependent oxidoreductase, partial [Deinococcus pimensis]|uniref:FAD-dependent oxidoreductase n=1 Tax=Deinococcus pimensis TaxID=309888 RepID=UPI0004861701
GRLGRYRGLVPRLDPRVLLDYLRVSTRLERLKREVPLDAPWQAPRAAEWDAVSFETWVARYARHDLTRALMRLYAGAVFAAEPRDLSLLHVLFYTRAGGDVNGHTLVRGHALQDRVLGGAQSICEALARDLGDAVRLGAPVTRVTQDADGVTVTAAGER